jgi:RNA polymerase sigma-70 factor (ECF subfamily)
MPFRDSQASGRSISTSDSLLERVRARDGEAWRQLVELYGPLIYRWARKAGLQSDDAQDVTQNVCITVATDIHRYGNRQPGASFRGWLWTICRHKIIDRFRDREHEGNAVGGSEMHQRLLQVAAAEPTREEADEELRQLRQRALDTLRKSFEPHTWAAFVRTVIHGDRPGDVARDLGISVATVYRAKSCVLERIRAEVDTLE